MAKVLTNGQGVAEYGDASTQVVFSLCSGPSIPVAVFVSSVAAPTAASPVPEDDVAPATPTLDLVLSNVVDDAGGNDAEFDPFSEVHMESFRGLEVITDGFTRNKEFDGDRVTFLEIEAPETKPSVAADTPAGSGISGTYTYRYRYRNSKTDKVSGFSPASDEVSPSSQEVNVTSITVSSDDQVDRIQVFRCQDSILDTWFFLTELDNTGTPTYADEVSDATLQTGERYDLREGRTFNEGLMWPMLKSREHLGFMYYFGLNRMPEYEVGDVSGSAAGNELTGANGCAIRDERLGQKIKIAGDETDYWIVSINDPDNNKFKVYPALETSPSNASFYIEDDRNGQLVEISEAGWNASVPVSHQLELGHEKDNICVGMISLLTGTYFLCNKSIYSITGEKTTEPWNTLSIDRVAIEGPCGPNAYAEIPGYGIVYVDESRGPRWFDGNNTGFLGSDGEETTILEEWRRFNEDRKWHTVVRYSEDKNQVLISYARDTELSLTHQMVFSLATGEWLGPWTRRMTSYGELLVSDYTPVKVVGTDLGAVWQDYHGTRDSVDTGTLSGTLTAVSGRVFTDSSAALTTTEDGLYGALVEFLSPTKTPVYTYIVDNTGTTITTLDLPSPYPAVGWTYNISPIPWVCRTGYIDGGNPHNEKLLDTVHARWSRGTSGNVRCAVGVNGGSLYEVSSGEESLAGTVHGRFRVHVTDLSFQIQMDGSGYADDPEITQVLAYLELYLTEQ